MKAPAPATHISKNDPPNARGQITADRQKARRQRKSNRTERWGIQWIVKLRRSLLPASLVVNNRSVNQVNLLQRSQGQPTPALHEMRLRPAQFLIAGSLLDQSHIVERVADVKKKDAAEDFLVSGSGG